MCSLTISAVILSGSAIAGPSLVAAAERPVYVTNADDTNDISTFTVDLTTGHPTLADELVKAGDGVRQMAFTPNARTAYASNSADNTISVYTVGPRGKLTPLAGKAGTVKAGGITPAGLAVTPNGHTLYVAHVDSNSVSAFTIASDGGLRLSATVSTSVDNPRGLSMTPDGRFLYAGHGDPNEGRPTSVGAITAFAIQGNGSLTPAGTPIRVGRFCGQSAITGTSATAPPRPPPPSGSSTTTRGPGRSGRPSSSPTTKAAQPPWSPPDRLSCATAPRPPLQPTTSSYASSAPRRKPLTCCRTRLPALPGRCLRAGDCSPGDPRKRSQKPAE